MVQGLGFAGFGVWGSGCRAYGCKTNVTMGLSDSYKLRQGCILGEMQSPKYSTMVLHHTYPNMQVSICGLPKIGDRNIAP